MNTVAQTCLNNVDLVLQYIEAQEKIESIAKDYDQQISQARKTKEQHSLNMSEQQIMDEFERVAKIMTNNLRARYQAQYNVEDEKFKNLIRDYSSYIKQKNSLVEEYTREIPRLEKLYNELNQRYEKISKDLTSDVYPLVRKLSASKYKEITDNPITENLNTHLRYLKDNVKEIPEENISILSGGKTISKNDFLNKYIPTYSVKNEDKYPEELKITILFPNGLKGSIFKKMKSRELEQIEIFQNSFNSYFKKWCAAENYMCLFKYHDVNGICNRLDMMKGKLPTLKKEVREYENKLSKIEKQHKDFIAIRDIRRYIDSGYLKNLTKQEVEEVKRKSLKEAASRLAIKEDDLLDYIACSESDENFVFFQTACFKERAKKYIESSNRKQSSIAILETEKAQKLSAIKIPNLELIFRKWNDEYPLYAQMGFPEQMDQESVEKTMEAIARTAAKNYGLKIFPNGDCFHLPTAGGLAKNAKGEYLWAPSFSSPNGSIPNLMLAYSKETMVEAKQSLNRALINLLLSVPPRKAKLRIIDLAATNMASLITTRLSPSLYNNEVVMNDRELRSVIEEWQARTKRIIQKCENLAQYNEQNKTWLEPYEIVVVLGYPQSISPNCEDMLRPFVQNGAKSGIYFIWVTNSDMLQENSQSIIKEKGLFKTVLPFIPRGKYFPYPYTPIADQKQLLDYTFEYLNAEACKKEEKPIAVQDVRQLAERPYQPDTAANIKVAVGDDNGRNVYFELDTLNHLHAFILGQSGTGKSRFLHNIIGNIMLAHSPQNVEFYLMDLKLGGVEFNVYKGEKHVRALLVDNNDRQITLEVLRDLSMRMEQRNKEFAEAGVRNLEAYNQKAGTPMPQIVLVVDECQMLFTERPDNTERELRDILSLIVKQGRSQGVHMILSTQTLMNSTIPIDVLQGAGLTDLYLLNCDPRDSEKLVKGSSAKTGTLQTGEIYYHHHQHSAPDAQFRAFYVDDEQQNAILEGAVQKSKDLDAPGQFYFSGKLQAHLSEEVISSMQRRSRRSLCASFGVGIDLKQQPVNISLSEEQGENVLIFGLNQRHQATRTATETFLSALYSARAAGRDTEFIVIDCLSSEDETPYQILFDSLEDQGLIRQVFGRQRGELLSKLGDSVRSHKANETLILILGQDRWRELRNDKELEVAQTGVEQKPAEGASFLGGLSFPSTRTQQRTYRSELQYLLENGAEDGVHFIVQVDKPQNLIGGQNVSQQMVKKLFRHWIMLRSAADASLSLRLRDDIRLENLSDDLDRLRAIYYCDDTDSYQLITPYRYTTEEENKNLINL